MSAAPQPLWTADAAADATGGKTDTSWAAAGVSIDSRSLEPQDLFVAIKGPAFDGHDFVPEALKNGAAAAMVSRAPRRIAAAAPLLMVADTLTALEDLGRAARGRTGARIAAVTGSVGKTGVKEALRLALGAQGAVYANEGSLNNHWGLPLSLARMPAGSEFGVFEMGMNHPGEIESLAKMARPHVAVVTTIEAVHAAHFESTDGIADAKAEIFSGLEPDGAAVLNRDNPYFERLADAARRAGAARVFGFGAHDGADVRLAAYDLGDGGSDVTAQLDDRTITFRVGVPGRHWVLNSLCVLAAVAALGADLSAAAGALGKMSAPKGRGQRHAVSFSSGEITVIDESYNASPASMAAALGVLARTEPGLGSRRIAVLGDMLELGRDSARLHTDLLEPIRESGVDLVFTAGRYMAGLSDVMPKDMRGGHAATSERLAPMVLSAVRPGDVVTVKGSAGSRMNVIVRALLNLDCGSGPDRRMVNGE